MIDTTWRIEDEGTGPDVAGAPRPLLTTWPVLLGALRRGWLTWVGLALVGCLAAMALLVIRPPGGQASATILLVHPTANDPSAMATDVSLLETRAVATRVIADLGLELSADALLSTVSADPVTDQILRVTVTGPTASTAVQWADSLVTEFLDFRSTQLRSLSEAQVRGYRDHVADLQAQLDDATRQYNALGAADAAARTGATDLLSARTELSSQINSTQRAIEDASYSTDAAISSSYVVDDPYPVPYSLHRTVILYLASGLIVGAALGLGLVVFRALTSDRARTRRDVSLALGVPVRASVRSVGAPRSRAGGLVHSVTSGVTSALDRVPRPSWLTRRHPHGPTRGATILANALEQALPLAQRPATARDATWARDATAGVGLAAVDDPYAAALVLRALALRLVSRRLTVLLVDLSESGALGNHALPGTTVFRPSGIPWLSPGPGLAGSGAVIDPQKQDRLREVWDEADVVLVLIEVDPGMDVENLASWVERLVPLVTAGRTRAELLATISEVVHAAGIALPFALMTGSDATDATAGIPDSPEAVVEARDPLVARQR